MLVCPKNSKRDPSRSPLRVLLQVGEHHRPHAVPEVQQEGLRRQGEVARLRFGGPFFFPSVLSLRCRCRCGSSFALVMFFFCLFVCSLRPFWLVRVSVFCPSLCFGPSSSLSALVRPPVRVGSPSSSCFGLSLGLVGLARSCSLVRYLLWSVCCVSRSFRFGPSFRFGRPPDFSSLCVGPPARSCRSVFVFVFVFRSLSWLGRSFLVHASTALVRLLCPSVLLAGARLSFWSARRSGLPLCFWSVYLFRSVISVLVRLSCRSVFPFGPSRCLLVRRSCRTVFSCWPVSLVWSVCDFGRSVGWIGLFVLAGLLFFGPSACVGRSVGW